MVQPSDNNNLNNMDRWIQDGWINHKERESLAAKNIKISSEGNTGIIKFGDRTFVVSLANIPEHMDNNADNWGKVACKIAVMLVKKEIFDKPFYQVQISAEGITPYGTTPNPEVIPHESQSETIQNTRRDYQDLVKFVGRKIAKIDVNGKEAKALENNKKGSSIPPQRDPPKRPNSPGVSSDGSPVVTDGQNQKPLSRPNRQPPSPSDESKDKDSAMAVVKGKPNESDAPKPYNFTFEDFGNLSRLAQQSFFDLLRRNMDLVNGYLRNQKADNNALVPSNQPVDPLQISAVMPDGKEINVNINSGDLKNLVAAAEENEDRVVIQNTPGLRNFIYDLVTPEQQKQENAKKLKINKAKFIGKMHTPSRQDINKQPIFGKRNKNANTLTNKSQPDAQILTKKTSSPIKTATGVDNLGTKLLSATLTNLAGTMSPIQLGTSISPPSS